MKFWDSSAIGPLACAESASALCRSRLRRDPVMLVWALAATEVVSALARQRRERILPAAVFAAGKRCLDSLEKAWNEVAHYDAVRARARRLLETHPLRATDSLHLAAALVAVEERPTTLELVTFDARLAEAAEKEGFRVLSA